MATIGSVTKHEDGHYQGELEDPVRPRRHLDHAGHRQGVPQSARLSGPLPRRRDRRWLASHRPDVGQGVRIAVDLRSRVRIEDALREPRPGRGPGRPEHLRPDLEPAAGLSAARLRPRAGDGAGAHRVSNEPPPSPAHPPPRLRAARSPAGPPSHPQGTPSHGSRRHRSCPSTRAHHAARWVPSHPTPPSTPRHRATRSPAGRPSYPQAPQMTALPITGPNSLHGVPAKLPIACTDARQTTITDDPPTFQRAHMPQRCCYRVTQSCDAVRRSLFLTSNRVLRDQPFLIRIVSTVTKGSMWTQISCLAQLSFDGGACRRRDPARQADLRPAPRGPVGGGDRPSCLVRRADLAR